MNEEAMAPLGGGAVAPNNKIKFHWMPVSLLFRRRNSFCCTVVGKESSDAEQCPEFEGVV